MTVHPLRPEQLDTFEPFGIWTIPDAYAWGIDTLVPVRVEAGHDPIAGLVVRVDGRDFTTAQAMALSEHLVAAVRWLADNVELGGEAS
jgi:hypothetical protein